MASEFEIAHARHRAELSRELDAFIRTASKELDLELCGLASELVPFDGEIKGDTIAEQALRLRHEYSGGHWIDLHITATGDTWDAYILVASSAGDGDFTIPPGETASPALPAIRQLLEKMS